MVLEEVRKRYLFRTALFVSQFDLPADALDGVDGARDTEPMPLVAVSPGTDAVGIPWSFACPPAVLWAALTEPASIAQWLGDAVECDIRPGGSLVVDHDEGYRSRSTVIEVAPPRLLVMTWEFPNEPASEVAFTLRESGDGTVLELAHAVAPELTASYRVGWIVHLTYLESVLDEAPLPASQFWKLHATLQRGFGD
jgi:uncharacterized protein YndB with AHSA1/START domain